MQLFSLPLAAAAATPSPEAAAAAVAAPAGSGFVPVLLWLLLSQVVAIAAYWVSSKAIADDDKSTFLNSLRAWMAYLVVTLFLIILFVVLVFVGSLVGNATIVLALVAVTGLVALALALYVPMKVYKLGMIKALGFVLAAYILSTAATLALERAAGLKDARSGLFTRISGSGIGARWDKVAAKLSGKDEIDTMLARAEATADAKSLEARQEDLRAVYAKLEERRAAAGTDVKAQEQYKRQLAQFEKQLAALKADAEEKK
jgi:hypothetical protein